jgi:hypothetical protein
MIYQPRQTKYVPMYSARLCDFYEFLLVNALLTAANRANSANGTMFMPTETELITIDFTETTQATE